MIKLIIDGKEAVIKAGTSFKLTRMNPYFEDQGDFTFEVQLPLDGCAENLAIFGALHRAEVGKVGLIGKKYDMQLIAPPVDVHGYAQITNITDTEVKVQLVAGRSSFSHAIEDTAVYVMKWIWAMLGIFSLNLQTEKNLGNQGWILKSKL